MRNVSLAMVGILLTGVFLATSISAFEVGENRMENSSFEIGNAGDVPAKWELKVTG